MSENKNKIELNEEDLENVSGGGSGDVIVPLIEDGDPPGLLPPEKFDYICPTCFYNFGKYEKNVVFIGGVYCPTCKINVSPILKD